jgi:hypothetical protein
MTTVISDKSGIAIRKFTPKDATTKESVSQRRMLIPGWKRVLDLTLIVLTTRFGCH